MRPLIFIAGIITLALGFISHAQLEDPTLLQGALTLGGGWIICGLFSIYSKLHGFIGAAVLALLAAGRSLIEIPKHHAPEIYYLATVFMIATVILIKITRFLLAERAKKQLAALDPTNEN